jgi:hypothetical protein
MCLERGHSVLVSESWQHPVQQGCHFRMRAHFLVMTGGGWSIPEVLLCNLPNLDDGRFHVGVRIVICQPNEE